MYVSHVGSPLDNIGMCLTWEGFPVSSGFISAGKHPDDFFVLPRRLLRSFKGS